MNIFFYFKGIINSGLEEGTTIIFLLASSLLLRFLLEAFGQRWIRTISHTSTLVILPIITYIITTVISGNIALSLGMVGALSIVRFRNPVRSPLELCVYFAAITMGITAAVSLKRQIFFMVSILFVSILLYLFSKIFHKISKKKFFTTSFSEGNALSTLEINCMKKIPLIDKSRFLKSKSFDQNKINYLLVSENFHLLKDLLNKVEDNDDLIYFQLNEE